MNKASGPLVLELMERGIKKKTQTKSILAIVH
jgi:hypothetical protein